MLIVPFYVAYSLLSSNTQQPAHFTTSAFPFLFTIPLVQLDSTPSTYSKLQWVFYIILAAVIIALMIFEDRTPAFVDGLPTTILI